MKDLPVRSANIAELRDQLTHYLREVRAGEEIIVRDQLIRPIDVAELQREHLDASETRVERDDHHRAQVGRGCVEQRRLLVFGDAAPPFIVFAEQSNQRL